MSNNEMSCVVQGPCSVDRRGFLRRVVLGMGAGALALAAVKPALADTILTRNYVSVNGDKLAKTATCVVGKYGATDFLTDDYASDDLAVQAAIDYVEGLGGGVVSIREGTYELNNTINITHDDISIIGAGSYATSLKPGTGFSAGDALLDISGSAVGTRVQNYTLRDFGLFGDTDDVIGLHMQYCDKGHVENLEFIQLRNNGILCNGAWDTLFTNLYAWDCGSTTKATLHLDDVGVGTDWCNNLFFDNCRLESSVGVTGYLTQKTRQIYFNGCKFHGKQPTPSAYDALYLNGSNVEHISIIGSTFGFVGASLIKSSGATNLRIIGNSIDNPGGQASPGVHGISITSGSRIIIAENCIQNQYHSGINLESGTSDVLITGNQIKDNADNAIDAGSGIQAYNVSNLSIRNNDIEGSRHEYAVKVTGTGTNSIIEHNRLSIGNTGVLTCAGAGKIVRDNMGYNPLGNFAAPSVPATTVNYTNNYGFPCQVLISGGTVTNIDLDDIATGLTSGMFVIAPGETINITYSSVPTWKWWGL